MNSNTRNRTFPTFRWTQRIAASLSCLAVVGCGGGDGSAAPDTQAAAPTQLLATQTTSGSSAASIGAERYNRVVYQLYLAYYGRPPDPASLSKYSSKLSTIGVQPNLNALVADYQKKNSKVRALIDEFAASAEFKSMYSTNTDQFLNQLYRTILGRAPDAGAIDFWGDLIDGGKLPRALAALALMSSAAASNTDAATIDKKLEASGKFTSAIEELNLSSKYLDNTAINTGRNLLNGVSSTTDASSLTTSVAASITLLVPPKRTATLESIAPDAVTDVRIENVDVIAHTNVPFTFGQPFAAGSLAVTDQLIGRLANGSTIALQMDVKATHPDGSVRHAIISGVMPSLAALDIQRIDLLKANAAGTPTVATPSKAAATISSRVEITLDGIKYSADLADAMAGGKVVRWLGGPIASELLYSTPFKSANGATHPHLTARFDVRSYPQLDKQARVDVVVENAPTFTPGQRNYTYDVQVLVNNQAVYSRSALTHYHHSRWHRAVWTNQTGTSPVHVMHNTGYLIATRAVPNYDQNVVPKDTVLSTFTTQLTNDKVGPMTIGPVVSYMPTTGGRADIGPLPSWAVTYLLSMDRRARDTMMAAADGSGTWSIHYRDENTGHPVRLDNSVNRNISTHMNLGLRGPLPVPRCANNDNRLCATPYSPDTSHQPALTYLPYLLTGDYYYLEELQFWAAWNPLGTDPANHGYELGLVRWDQVRGQAWSLRTLTHAAYITPDSHYLKGYFGTQLNNNITFYHNTYVVGNPNKLGAYDGSGQSAFPKQNAAPWQDDYLTWSFGNMVEMGFSNAKPIFEWKAKFPVGRLTAPGFCWLAGSAYWLQMRDTATSPVYGSFAEMYTKHFSARVEDDNGKALVHPAGVRFVDLPCDSQAQMDWFKAAGASWRIGQMMGYASSEMGYPSNMQPALALAATYGATDGVTAWNKFASRSVKPDYTKGAQFAIIPR